jgi:hypothetical protein
LKSTEILAIYAACLSTIIFIWNILRTIPRYKVDIVFGVHENDGESKHGVYIFTRNSSPHTVHLSGIDILYPYKKSRSIDLIRHILKYRQMPGTVGWVNSSLSKYGLEDKCPLALESGKSHGVFIPHEILEEILKDNEQRQIRACVQDQLWRNKYSKKFEYPKVGVDSE